MSVSVTVAGVSYTIPTVGDVTWGPSVTSWIQAISAVTLQTSGGNFTLTSDLNFGSSFGLISKYFTSVASGASSTGTLRLAKTDTVSWRNNANSANIALGLDGSDNLTFGGTKVLISGAIVNTDIASGAAIAYSKLNLTGNIVNADINASAAIVYSKLNLTTSIVNGDISASAAIAYSKLSLTGSIVNADIGASAAIAYSKLNLAGAVKMASDVTGLLPIANGGTNNASLSVAAGAVPYFDGSKFATLAPGSSGNVLTSGGAGAPTWSSPLVNPMTTGGDIIYGGASGVVTRLANGSSGQYLASAGGTSPPAWTSFSPVTIQKFLSTGTTTGWLFTISTSSTVAIGDTYTNNGNTYTVLAALTAQTGQVFFTSGASAPTASGTLTKGISVSGPATITFSASVALATYTTSSSPRTPAYIRVRAMGPGGGGGASGSNAAQTSGGNGGTTVFGANLLIANGGVGGSAGGSGNGSGGGIGGNGGTASLGTGPTGIAVAGGAGANGGYAATGQNPTGGIGCPSAFSGNGVGGNISAGGTAAANSGSGGGGAAGNTTSTIAAASGGGAGGFIDAIITSPAATYVYAIGVGGTNGAAGAGGFNGGSGAAGMIIVEEHYQ